MADKSKAAPKRQEEPKGEQHLGTPAGSPTDQPVDWGKKGEKIGSQIAQAIKTQGNAGQNAASGIVPQTFGKRMTGSGHVTGSIHWNYVPDPPTPTG